MTIIPSNKKLFLIILLMIFISSSAVNAENSIKNEIKLKINDTDFDVELENNSATEELIKILEKENITINAEDYGGFEKVGDLGLDLPTSDENINTSLGDIVLYQGNYISLFYDSHSWSYTKLGKIKNIDQSQLKEILGTENVTLVLHLE